MSNKKTANSYSRESRELSAFRKKWTGVRVTRNGEPATVTGVCDDGHICDYDMRRRYRPTGEIIILRDGAAQEEFCLPSHVIKTQ